MIVVVSLSLLPLFALLWFIPITAINCYQKNIQLYDDDDDDDDDDEDDDD